MAPSPDSGAAPRKLFPYAFPQPQPHHQFPSDGKPRRRDFLAGLLPLSSLMLHLGLLALQGLVTVWLVRTIHHHTEVLRALLPPAHPLRNDSAQQQLSTKAGVGHLYGLGSSLLPPGFKPFEQLLEESNATKKEHRFGHMYGEYLDPMRLQQAEVNMLEIGLQWGASLNLWFAAFPRGRVYGLEYNRLDMRDAREDEAQRRVTIFCGDQANVTLLGEASKRVRREVGLLDLIVDDGGHSMQQQIVSFTHLMPLVRPGGVYFIEDLQTSYWSRCHHHWNKEKYCYGGGAVGKKNTTIAMIKSFIDVLNADFMEDNKHQNELGTGSYSVNPSDGLIGSIQCWRNMCAFRRKFADSKF